MNRLAMLLGVLLIAGCTGQGAAQTDSPEPAGPMRLYVFDCGSLTLNDVTPFGLTNEETPVRSLFVPCYLIDHPDGRLLWDAGLPLTAVGRGDVPLEPGTSMRYDRSVIDQLADLGLQPDDIDYLALSHMHFDHTGAANVFTGATLLIQQPEYDAAFVHAEDYPVFEPDLYRDLAGSERRLLTGDLDLFGDGRVVLLSAPGHTPGHQALFLDLETTGPLVLSGDLYHFRASRTLRRTPVFNTDAGQTLASMDRIEAFIRERNATLWIEHDQALADRLRLAPGFYD